MGCVVVAAATPGLGTGQGMIQSPDPSQLLPAAAPATPGGAQCPG